MFQHTLADQLKLGDDQSAGVTRLQLMSGAGWARHQRLIDPGIVIGCPKGDTNSREREREMIIGALSPWGFAAEQKWIEWTARTYLTNVYHHVCQVSCFSSPVPHYWRNRFHRASQRNSLKLYIPRALISSHCSILCNWYLLPEFVEKVGRELDVPPKTETLASQRSPIKVLEGGARQIRQNYTRTPKVIKEIFD